MFKVDSGKYLTSSTKVRNGKMQENVLKLIKVNYTGTWTKVCNGKIQQNSAHLLSNETVTENLLTFCK